MTETENEKREIVFAWEFWEWGGGQIYFLGIMREAVARGWRVRAAMPVGSSEKLIGYLTAAGVEVEFFPARVDLSPAKNIRHKIRRRLRDAHCHWVLARHLARTGLKNTIVQLEASPWSAFTLFYFLARRTEVFLTLHIALPFSPTSSLGRVARAKFHRLCKLPNFHLLASNEDMKKSLRPFVPETVWNEIPVAYTGVNTTEIKTALESPLEREKLLAKFDLPADKILVFSLGNIIERKGFRVFLEAARLLCDAETRRRGDAEMSSDVMPSTSAVENSTSANVSASPRLRVSASDLFFVWLGDGEQRQTMRSLIQEFGLQNRVKNIRPADFGGERQDLLQILRLADIYVHPSFAEGLPGAMLEALALGKPAVASRVNAIPECITEGENGFLIEAGNAAGFAAAVERLANDANLRESFGRNAQARVLQNFTEERCAAVTIDFYNRCFAVKQERA